MKIILKTDGASRGNPGLSACAFVIINQDIQDNNIISQSARKLGILTNNQAEYLGLIDGLNFILNNLNLNSNNLSYLEIQMDSELIIKQQLREYKVKNLGLIELFSESQKILSEIKNKYSCEIKFKHIRRNLNSLADSLCNKILDN